MDNLLVQLVHEQIDGLVQVVGFHGTLDIRPVDGKVAFGDEGRLLITGVIVTQLHIETDDALIVIKEAAHFVRHVVLETGGEVDVVTRDNDGVVHVFSELLWFALGSVAAPIGDHVFRRFEGGFLFTSVHLDRGHRRLFRDRRGVSQGDWDPSSGGCHLQPVT